MSEFVYMKHSTCEIHGAHRTVYTITYAGERIGEVHHWQSNHDAFSRGEWYDAFCARALVGAALGSIESAATILLEHATGGE